MRKTISASESSSLFLLAICVGSIVSYLIMLFIPKNLYFDGMSVANWVGYVIMQICFIATVFAFSRVRRVDILSVARMRGTLNIKQICLLPFISIACILLFLPLANAWSAFMNIIGYHGSVAMPAYSNVGIYFLSLLVMAILPAFGEELLMRGGVFSGLSTRGGWFGVFMSGLFFSLMHANPMQTVHQFGLGAVLAIVVALSGSLWAGALVHFFNNFISITLTAYLPQVDKLYVSLGYWNWLTGAASVVVGFVLLIVLLYLFYRAGNKKQEGFRIVSGGIEYDDFRVYATVDNARKSNVFADAFRFFASLFTKRGWKIAERAIENANGVEMLGKNQPMIGVWLALGLMCAYWLISFITGIVG